MINDALFANVLELPEHDFVQVEHPLLSIWAQHRKGCPAITVGFTGKPPEIIPDTKGFSVIRDISENRLMNYVSVVSKARRIHPAFVTVISEAFEKSVCCRTEAESVEAFFREIDEFRRHFAPDRRGHSAAQLRGIVAELLTVDRLVASGMDPRTVMRAWQGPYMGTWDFVLGASSALEVKSTGIGGQTITISSRAQLDPDDVDLQLVVWPIADVDPNQVGSVSLGCLVERVATRLAAYSSASDLFHDAIEALGLGNADTDYAGSAYQWGELKCLNITDEFPLVAKEALPPEVRSFEFSLDLASLERFQGKLNDFPSQASVDANAGDRDV